MRRLALTLAAAHLLLVVTFAQGARGDGKPQLPGVTQNAQAASSRMAMLIGTSRVVRLKWRLKRISVGDEKVVEVLAVSPKELVLNAKGEGITSIVVWDEKGEIFSYEVEVQPLAKLLNEIRARLAKILPKQSLTVEQAGGGLVISGSVLNPEAKKVALGIGELYTPKKVVDNIRVDDVPAQVLLKVHFAEISRSGAIQVGLGIVSNSSKVGGGTTRQYESFFFPGAPGIAPSGDTSEGLAVSFTDIITFFFSTSKISSTSSSLSRLFLRALQQKGYIRSLSQPHLRAVHGQKATFLAGGEVPVPVPGQDGTVTITYKPFGVELEFTPKVKETGFVELEIKPSVSSVDESLSVVVSGFNVPGFKKSNTATRVELREGQTMAISGLLSESASRSLAQVPFIGDVPILGELFRSRDFQENKSELVVLVTPTVIRPDKAAGLELPRRGFAVGRVPVRSGARAAGSRRKR